ncbi:MAG TPA: hypothetical protein VN903_26680 [Polyangia bacterium]|nr:hypothetical protein [Polyangia bacterium]
MPVGVRLRLFRWVVILFLIVLAVCGAFFAPGIYADLTAKKGTFETTRRKFDRLRQIAYWRSPEQKRLVKGLDGAPKAPAPAPRTYYVPRH